MRVLKGAQEEQLNSRFVGESRVVLASQVAKYGTRLTSQVRTQFFSGLTDTDCYAL